MKKLSLIIPLASTLLLFSQENQDLSLSDATLNNALNTAFAGYTQLSDSLNADKLDQFFGSGGVNLAATDPITVMYVKSFYAFLETLAKYEKGSESQKQEILTTLRALKIATIGKNNSAATEQTTWNEAISTAQQQLNTTLAQLTITADEVKASAIWQTYIKYTLAQLFNQMESIASNANSFQLGTYKYLPDLDVAIHQTDCRNTWYTIDFMRHYLVLLRSVTQRLAASCADDAWSTTANNFAALSNQIKVYIATPFYQAASQPEQFVTTSDDSINADHATLGALTAIEAHYITAIHMAAALQKKLNPLFNRDKFSQTMTALAASSPTPSILPYTLDDYVYLSELNDTRRSIAAYDTETLQPITFQDDENEDIILSSVSTSRNETVVPQNYLSDVWDGIVEGGKEAVDALSDVPGDIANWATDTWEGVSKGTVGFFTGNQALMDEASKAFGKANDSIVAIINDLGEAERGALHSVGAGLSFVLGFGDPTLQAEFESLFNSAADIVVDAIEGVTGGVMKLHGTVFRLGFDTIRIVNNLLVGGIEVIIGEQSLGEWGNNFKNIVEDMGVAILSSLTFIGDKLLDILQDAIKFIAYLTNYILDVILDVVRGLETLYHTVVEGQNIVDAWQRSKSAAWAADHRRLLFNIVLGIEFAVITIALGGGPLILGIGLTLDAAFGVFGAIGGGQQDEAALERKQEQHAFVANYETFINNTESTMIHLQQVMADELDKKYGAQISNMERSLGFYQGFLGNRYESTKGQLAQNLRAYNIALLTADQNTGAIPADVGSLYGFRTRVNDLNPGQGFTVYNDGRKSYSQEIAVSPSTVEPADDTASSSPESKYWFLQKVVTSVSSLAEVEVRWQAQYVLSTYHIGLYLGGEPFETVEELNASSDTIINHAHLAKMFVYKKTLAESPSTIGLYEHDTTLETFNDNWYQGTLSGPAFEVGAWYRMKAQLSGSTLQVKIWKEGETEPGFSSIAVTPTNETTLGFIASGASVEFDFLSPEITAQTIPKLRGQDREQNEIDRELDRRAARAQSKSPQFGSFVLTAVSDTDLMLSQFMYTTPSTQLNDAQGAATQDYVVFANRRRAGEINDIGCLPTDGNCVVSLVTGKVYDSGGTVTDTVSTVLNSYEQRYGHIDDTTRSSIVTLQQAYTATVQGPFDFGSYRLQASSLVDLGNNVFIYTAIKPDTTADADYVVMAHLDASNMPAEFGMPYTSDINGIISLVSGSAYTAAQEEPVQTGFTRIYSLHYQSIVSTNLKTKIEASQAAYQAQPAQEQTTDALPTVVPTNSQNVSEPPTSDTGSGEGNVGETGAPEQSLNEQQANASGTEPVSSGIVLEWADDNDGF
ncbi:hypothetical protein JW872_01205 [Candidatus Babeliales bacterium]|nr:hypothetical protein [Candidatus Babeliales bacterium]